jgi:putative transposase
MARLPRIVIPGLPHLVTQRGNRQERTFFNDGDYKAYRQLIAEAALRTRTEIWAYCLMPNHVHMILVPSNQDGLRGTLAEAHRRYTTRVNKRNGWTGHLWQGRFGAVLMDEEHLIDAVHYISLNPVRAGLVEQPEHWPWSSVSAHLKRRNDSLVTVKPVLERVPDFASLLEQELPEEAAMELRRAETIGRPLGSESFFDDLETRLGFDVRPQRRGRKPKSQLEEIE